MASIAEGNGIESYYVVNQLGAGERSPPGG